MAQPPIQGNPVLQPPAQAPLPAQVAQVAPLPQNPPPPSKPLSKEFLKSLLGLFVTICFFPVPLEILSMIISPFVRPTFLYPILFVACILMGIYLPHKNRTFAQFMMVFSALYVCVVLVAVMKPRDPKDILVSALEEKVMAQPTAIRSFAKNFFGIDLPNIYIFLGPSGVGKTSMALSIAKHFENPPWTKNILLYRLSRLSAREIAHMLRDVKNLFDPAIRGTVAEFVEGTATCLMSTCVVVFDDFHIFNTLHPDTSCKFISRLHKYAEQHKQVVFVITVESTSTRSITPTSPEKSKIDEALLALYGSNKDTYEYQENTIKDLVATHIKSLNQTFLPRWQLIPFTSLNNQHVSKCSKPASAKHSDFDVASCQRGWESLLYDAAKKKLEFVAKTSEQLFHNLLLQGPEKQAGPPPIEIADEVIEVVVKTAFLVVSPDRPASPGMRSIEQDWAPQVYHAIKIYYQTYSSIPCNGYLYLQWAYLNQPNRGDLTCVCMGNMLSKWFLGVKNRVSSFRWESYSEYIVHGRNALVALEKVMNYW